MSDSPSESFAFRKADFFVFISIDVNNNLAFRGQPFIKCLIFSYYRKVSISK